MIPVMVLPTLTRHDLARQMIASIDYPVENLLVINNGKDDFDCELNAFVANMRVLDMPNNFGCAGSWNLGIKSFPFAPWWMIVSDDVTFHAGALEIFAEACGPDVITISDEWPFYQFFGVGEAVVNVVGLFDENLYPANFEDDDYQRRAEFHGIKFNTVSVPHDHVKQATVHAPEYALHNARTYNANENYFSIKVDSKDFTSGEWSLDIRRANDWGK